MSHTAPFKLHPLLALLTATATGSLLANPQVPQVAHGQATFTQAGKALTVTNSPGAIINWQQFNIDRGELTRFVQQNAASQVLNRVVGADPSAILGKLQSNGRVFLVNPNGIVFGAGAQVDVAGLVASTLRLSDDDFLKNRLNFTDTPGAGSLQNQGSITTAVGGEVLLVAPKIENSGLIHAPDGKILLAAGRSVEVADIDRPNIRVEISNSAEEAVNLGTLMAQHISIYGGLVKNSGRIQASSAVMGQNGKIILKAAQRVELSPSSEVTATGSQGSTGGEISITAANTQGLANGGEVQVQGLVSVKPTNLVDANNDQQNKPLALINKAQTAIKNVVNQAPAQPTAEPAQATAQAAAPVVANAEMATQDEAAGSNALANVALGAAAGLVRGATLGQRTTAPNPATPINPTTPVPARPAPSSPALPVNPAAPASPAGGTGVGGSIRIGAGGRVLVGEGTRLDASGELGGGEILVGGGWQGLNPNLINSQVTYIASTATLYANADLRGNGGLVVV
ncbi:filamentous hemagglutinin N-terminal domain-containing protein, partial [Rhodoferax sp.]|uniref:two-partner secretion domain-containing protein n=1 Tax=Rhodoferax sp. TaxID=50421 RepID=UPI002623AC51